jgi:hypothetical protein
LIGATIASAVESEASSQRRRREPVYTREIDITRRPGPLSPVSLYWLCLAGTSFVPCFYGSMFAWDVAAGIWAAILYFPAAQFGATGLGMLVVLCCYRTGRHEAYRALGSIALLTLIGTLVGGAIVLVFCGAGVFNL